MTLAENTPTDVLTPTATASSVLQVQAGVLNRIAALWTLVKNRRAVSELLSLDDHMLHDIGVSRGDISEVLAAPGDASGQRRIDPRHLGGRRRRAQQRQPPEGRVASVVRRVLRTGGEPESSAVWSSSTAPCWRHVASTTPSSSAGTTTASAACGAW